MNKAFHRRAFDGVQAAELTSPLHRLDSLQALRGLAALLVMLLHAIQMTAAFAGFDDVTRNGLVPIGSFGVDIFFVLSGVVIAMLVARNRSNPQTPGGFAFRRAAKLLPG